MFEANEKKYEGVGLNYIKSGKGLFFYYNNNLLILHDANIPFITVVLPDKEVPLHGCNIVRIDDRKYTMEFFQSGYRVDCDVTEIDGNIHFFIKNNPYNGLIFAFYKEKNQKVRGVVEFLNKKDVIPENKLSFYIDKKYFFQNVNVKNYDLKVLDKVFLTVYQDRISFILDTVNTPDDLKKMTYINVRNFKIFGKRKVYEMTSDIRRISDEPKDGVIIKDYEHPEIIGTLKKHYGTVIFCIKSVFGKDSHFISYFSGNELILQKNGKYKINFAEEGAINGFKTVIRKYFDTTLDGIYFDSSCYTQQEADSMRKAVVSILPEYTKKIILFDSLPLGNIICGYYVVKDRKKIFNHPEYLNMYRYSGEFLLAAEVNNFNEVKDVPSSCDIVIVNN